MNLESHNVTASDPTRRTLVKGAAWATPVVLAAAATPAYAAASPIPPNGLNGWVTLKRDCWSQPNYSIDGRGRFTGGGNSDRGFWTFVNDPNATISDTRFTIWLPGNSWVFTNEASTSGWSNLTLMNPQPSNKPASDYYAYTATYTGAWTFNSTYKAWVANGHPYWTASAIPGGCSISKSVCSYVDRTITVNGTTVAFRRGPVCV